LLRRFVVIKGGRTQQRPPDQAAANVDGCIAQRETWRDAATSRVADVLLQNNADRVP
jgi:hypothetical protein